MLKTILIPTDFSDNAHKAVKYAIPLAVKTGAKIIFFNTYFVPTYIEDVPLDAVTEQNLKQEAAESLEVFKKELVQPIGDINTECVIRTGNAATEIAAFAKENKVDLIVMGTKGSTGISEYVFGSNTEDVIEKTDIPVLAIPTTSVPSNMCGMTLS